MSFEFYNTATPTGYTEEMTYRDGVEADITAINGNITDLTSSVTALEQVTGSVDLSVLTTVDKTSLVNAINETVTNITTNTNNISTNTSNITTNTTNITTNTTNIATNTANITKNTNDITDIATVNAANFPSLQAAHDYVVNNYNYGVVLIPHDITLTDTYYHDVKKVGLRGYGATLTFDINDLNKHAIEFTSSETVVPYNQSTTYFEGIKFRGVNKLCNGLKFDGASSIKAMAHIEFKNCEISWFNRGIDFRNHAYAISFNNCDILRNISGVYMGDGYVDYGEKLSFVNSMIYNNAYGINNSSPGGAIHLINCSIDYNTTCMINIENGAKVFCICCHIEPNATHFTSSNRPFYIGGDGSVLSMIGGWLLFGAYPSSTTDYVFQNSATGKGGVFLTDVYLAGLKTTTNYLATGGGYTLIKGTRSTASEEDNSILISSNMNLLKDGGFESTSMQDSIFVSWDTVAITNRTLTGTNAVLSLDSTQYRSGSKSLKATKVNNGGTNSGFTILVPITRASLVAWELYYKKVGSQTGSVVISSGFAKRALDDVIYKKQETTSQTITFTSATVDWTRAKNNADRDRCPMWATHFYVDVNMFSMNAGDIFFDDITITEM